MGFKCGLRAPTYTTARGKGGGGNSGGLSEHGCGHTSGIVSVVAIPTADDEGDGRGGIGEMLSFQDSNSFQVLC